MKNRTALPALAAAFIVSLSQAAQAGHVTPPPVPTDVEVDLAAFKPYLEGHATGTQNYVCVPSGSTFAWSLFTPQATLFNDNDRQLTTHFFSPNPEEKGTPVRATWQHSRDTSSFWGVATGQSSDPAFVAPGAIAWVRLAKAGTQDGPSGGDALSIAKFVQRVNTAGGLAPATGCSVATDVGKRAFQPYKADYIFYRERHSEGDDEDLN